MDADSYQQFVKLKESGRKAEASAAARRFAGSFAAFEEKQAWTREFLGRADFGHKIRHEIYREVVFAVLERGFHEGDFDSVLWLARTAQNLYSARDLHEQVGFLSENQLLRRAFEIRPQDEKLRRLLLRDLLGWLGYCEHEWPAGILYGNNAATPEECQMIAREVDFARDLDALGEHTELLGEFEARLNQHQERRAST